MRCCVMAATFKELADNFVYYCKASGRSDSAIIHVNAFYRWRLDRFPNEELTPLPFANTSFRLGVYRNLHLTGSNVARHTKKASPSFGELA
ncbi:MAG: hypothetical protein PWQ71_371 [Bacteroidota bacterium]|nr:hypothetical protein [Dysgonamonadaceae bacterium]MDN5296265.1 hypothetical protein [Bacteroidota bacterium]